MDCHRATRLLPGQLPQDDEAVPHVAASLRRLGWQQPIVARRIGDVVAGDAWFKAPPVAGPEPRSPLPDWTAAALRRRPTRSPITRTADFATWDDQSLVALLETFRAEEALKGAGFRDVEITSSWRTSLFAAVGESEVDLRRERPLLDLHAPMTPDRDESAAD